MGGRHGLAVVLSGRGPLCWPLVTARPLSELVDESWARALAPVQPQVAQMGEFLRAELAAGHRYLPAGPNVLRAFTFPFEKVRVLIVGQDPYPTPGHAVGLSFSVGADVRPLPRSLANIYTEYCNDLGHPAPSTGDLTPWAAQGVMLLNRVLTVRPGTPASHRGKGWEAVTECAIRALVARQQPAGRRAVGAGRRDAAADARQTRRPSSRRIRRRCRRRGVSSGRGRSAAPTNCSSRWGRPGRLAAALNGRQGAGLRETSGMLGDGTSTLTDGMSMLGEGTSMVLSPPVFSVVAVVVSTVLSLPPVLSSPHPVNNHPAATAVAASTATRADRKFSSSVIRSLPAGPVPSLEGRLPERVGAKPGRADGRISRGRPCPPSGRTCRR